MYGKKKIQKMTAGGLSGGSRSGAPKRMVSDPVIEDLNPGKSVDVTEMSMGGYMDDKMVKKMMGGGYMNYKDKM